MARPRSSDYRDRYHRRQERECMMPAPDQLPLPELEARAIDVDEYRAFTPEKFELLEGYLFDTPDNAESRQRLLRLLLVNVGLLEAVRLAPEERWREALQRVYKP